MDVDKIQKINSLALELMRQGLVEDREEAVIQAERILSKKDYTSLRETMDVPKKEEGPKNESSSADSGKWQEVLEKNNNYIVQKMKAFQEQIDGLKKEVETLRGSLVNVNRRVSNFNENPAPKETSSAPSKPAETKDHPRVGNYTTNEVSIEKFFYAGRK